MSPTPTSQTNEGHLYTVTAPDDYISFHTTLQLVTKQGCKPLPVTLDPGAHVNTITLSYCRLLFPKHFTCNGNLKLHTLRSTRCTWSLHDSKTKSFLGFFTTDVHTRPTQKSFPSHSMSSRTPQPLTLYPAVLPHILPPGNY